MHPLASRPVIKMNGLGNEILILDLRGTPGDLSPAAVKAIGRGDRLSFDQLMVIRDPRSPGTDASVQIYNSDGSEAGACGNGMRCVAWILLRGTNREILKIETAASVLECRRQGEWSFSVDMGKPRFFWRNIPLAKPMEDTGAIHFDEMPVPAAAINVGNPHAVFFVDDLDAYDLAVIGPKLEHHPLFPQRANITLARISSRDHIVAKVWERGAGLTRACGSAACAVLVAAARKALADREANVSLPGGDLHVTWREDAHVVLRGPVELEFEAVLDPLLFEGVAA
ncbi:MAG: diaminopimelate epimerase [Methylovirgula sp.]